MKRWQWHLPAALAVAACVWSTGVSWAQSPGFSWNSDPGRAKDIGGSIAGIWIITTTPTNGGFTIQRRAQRGGISYTNVPGGAVRIDVDPQGNAWVVNSNAQIFHWNGGDWDQIPGYIHVDVGVGPDGSVWAIGGNRVPGGYEIYRWNSKGWDKIPGGAVRIDADMQGNAWAVNDAGNIFHWNGGGWDTIPGGAIDIATGATGELFIVGTDHTPYSWNGRGWSSLGGQAVNITGSPTRAPLMTNPEGLVYWGAGTLPLPPPELPPPPPPPPEPEAPADPTEGDLAEILSKKVPVAAKFLDPLKGVVQLESIDFDDPDDRTQLVKLSANIDWKKAVATASAVHTGARENPFEGLTPAGYAASAFRDKAAVVTKNQKAALDAMLDNAYALLDEFGVQNPVPTTITVYDKNMELDLELSFTVAKGWKTVGPLGFKLGTKLAFRELNLKFHAKMNKGNLDRSLSAEVEAKMFAKPTARDPWLGVTPVIEPDSGGGITFGGDFTGACDGEPNAKTDPDSCDDEWDVMGLSRIRSKGGTLKLTVEEGNIKGVEAAVKEGRIAPDNIPVDGAVLVDADLSPGCGLVLQSKAKFKDTAFGVYKPIFGKYEPFKTLFSTFDKIPGVDQLPSQDVDLVLTPTGLTVGHIDIPKPMVRSNIIASSAGVKVTLRSDIQGDVEKILAGDLSGAPTGFMEVETNFGSINEAVNKLPLIKNLFVLKSVSSRVDIEGTTSYKGVARADYRLFDKDRRTEIPMVNVFDPNGTIETMKGLFAPKCAADQELGGLLCYPKCKDGYESDGAMLCKSKCPSDYRTEPLTCMRDTHIYGNKCSGKCDAGYTNDGCTCRRDAHSISRQTYDRGAGTTAVPLLQ